MMLCHKKLPRRQKRRRTADWLTCLPLAGRRCSRAAELCSVSLAPPADCSRSRCFCWTHPPIPFSLGRCLGCALGDSLCLCSAVAESCRAWRAAYVNSTRPYISLRARRAAVPLRSRLIPYMFSQAPVSSRQARAVGRGWQGQHAATRDPVLTRSGLVHSRSMPLASCSS